jgi:hypothetical protein
MPSTPATSRGTSSPSLAYLADLPTDYSDLDLEAAPLRTVPVQSEEDSDTHPSTSSAGGASASSSTSSGIVMPSTPATSRGTSSPDYSDLDLEAAPLRTVPVQSEEDSDTQLPPLGSTVPVPSTSSAGGASASSSTSSGIVMPSTPATSRGTLSEEDRSVELPIDYAAEQTTWTDEAREGSADADICRSSSSSSKASSACSRGS